MLLQENTAELFSEFIAKRGAAFNLNEEDFIDSYKKIYNFINVEEMSVE